MDFSNDTKHGGFHEVYAKQFTFVIAFISLIFAAEQRNFSQLSHSTLTKTRKTSSYVLFIDIGVYACFHNISKHANTQKMKFEFLCAHSDLVGGVATLV